MTAGMPNPPMQQGGTGLNFQSDPMMRSQFKGYMSGLQDRSMQQAMPMSTPMPMPMMGANIDIFQQPPMPMFLGGSITEEQDRIRDEAMNPPMGGFEMANRDAQMGSGPIAGGVLQGGMTNVPSNEQYGTGGGEGGFLSGIKNILGNFLSEAKQGIGSADFGEVGQEVGGGLGGDVGLAPITTTMPRFGPERSLENQMAARAKFFQPKPVPLGTDFPLATDFPVTRGAESAIGADEDLRDEMDIFQTSPFAEQLGELGGALGGGMGAPSTGGATTTPGVSGATGTTGVPTYSSLQEAAEDGRHGQPVNINGKTQIVAFADPRYDAVMKARSDAKSGAQAEQMGRVQTQPAQTQPSVSQAQLGTDFPVIRGGESAIGADEDLAFERISPIQDQINRLKGTQIRRGPTRGQDVFGKGMDALEQLRARAGMVEDAPQTFEQSLAGPIGQIARGISQGMTKNILEKIEAGGQAIQNPSTGEIVGVVTDNFFGGKVYTGRPEFDPVASGAIARGQRMDAGTQTGAANVATNIDQTQAVKDFLKFFKDKIPG